MEKNKRVLLGMSGGVDSSVAAILLKEQGYEVIGITMDLYKSEDSENIPIDDAKRVCDFLGIEHYTADFTEEFKDKVINNFICEYKNCRTPNPCIECNRYLKFQSMFQKAKELDCEYIATGHYAKIEFDEKYNQYVLKKSNAGRKDQSYVLYNVPKELLEKVLFPLSDFEDKSQIREIAAKYNLPVANKPDSEDICFIPNGDYKEFLEKNSDIRSRKGRIVLRDGTKVGEHTGLYKYTIGQRKGLGIAYRVPLFVLGFNSEKNELIVGEQNELYIKEFFVRDINLLIDEEINEKEVFVKTRYSSKEAKAILYRIDDKIKVVFEEPQKSITPGQSAVFYIDDIVIGGGKIV